MLAGLRQKECIDTREKAMREKLLAAAIACTATLGSCLPGIAQDNTDQKLGTVHFATSCNETAQRRFDRAMRYQHSFWYKASQEIYQEAIKADPQCAIAYWGIALSLLNNPHRAAPARRASAITSTRSRRCMSITTRSRIRRAFSHISMPWRRWPLNTLKTTRPRS